MSAEKTPYEMVGALPTLVPFIQRVQVKDARFGRDVEFRILRRDADDRQRAHFFDELACLLAVDDPAFLPILERGRIRGRSCYTVPLRRTGSLAKAASGQGLTVGEACAVAEDAARALAACHGSGVPLYGFDPKLLGWSPETGRLTVTHRLPGPPRYRLRPELCMPRDVTAAGVAFSPRLDVFHWGCFAYFCLTRGEFPYAGHRDLTPVLEANPEVPNRLAVTVEAALAEDPAERPRCGIDLVRVLRDVAAETVLEEDFPTFERPPTERFRAVRTRREPTRGFLAVLEGLPDPEVEDSPDMTMPTSDDLKQILWEIEEELPLSASGVLPPGAIPGRGGRGGKKPPGDAAGEIFLPSPTSAPDDLVMSHTSMQPGVKGPGLDRKAARDSARRVAAARREAGPPATNRYAQDPELVALVRDRLGDPGVAVSRLKMMAAYRRLPAQVATPARLEGLVAAIRDDADGGRAATEALLAELRDAIGVGE